MSATAANLELARSLELRSGVYRAPALPVELYQRSLCGDSNADHGLTRPVLLSLSYTSKQTLEAVGRIALPMICFAGRPLAFLATPPHNLERKAGLEPALSTVATSRLGHQTTSALTKSLSQQRKLNYPPRVGRPGHQ